MSCRGRTISNHPVPMLPIVIQGVVFESDLKLLKSKRNLIYLDSTNSICDTLTWEKKTNEIRGNIFKPEG